jgi:hypothetical protein
MVNKAKSLGTESTYKKEGEDLKGRKELLRRKNAIQRVKKNKEDCVNLYGDGAMDKRRR